MAQTTMTLAVSIVIVFKCWLQWIHPSFRIECLGGIFMTASRVHMKEISFDKAWKDLIDQKDLIAEENSCNSLIRRSTFWGELTTGSCTGLFSLKTQHATT